MKNYPLTTYSTSKPASRMTVGSKSVRPFQNRTWTVEHAQEVKSKPILLSFYKRSQSAKDKKQLPQGKDLRFAVPPDASRRMLFLIRPLARSSRPCLLYTLRIAITVKSTVSGRQKIVICGGTWPVFRGAILTNLCRELTISNIVRIKESPSERRDFSSVPPEKKFPIQSEQTI